MAPNVSNPVDFWVDLLRFQTPQGLRLSLSSLVTPRFANSYHLGSVGIVDGSISYLYSSVPLQSYLTPDSETLHLPTLCRAYHGLNTLPRRDPLAALKPTGEDSPLMFYGRLYLPQSLLEALVVKRFSPGLQLQLRAVSWESLKNGGSFLGLAQYDVGKYSAEGLASSDGGLLGLRGVYNFGSDDSEDAPPTTPSASAENSNGSNGSDKERIYGRFTAGGEIYYGTLNKSGGMSCGLRFATLPSHNGAPLMAMVTLNPLVGTIAASYAVRAGKFLSLGSRLDFNVYSYDSNWSVGMELWRKEVLPRLEEESVVEDLPRRKERSFQAKLEWRLDDPEPECKAEQRKAVEPTRPEDEFGSMIKARFDQNTRLGLLWEGRVKSLLFSIGTNIDLGRLDHPFRTLGLEIQYSS